MSSTSRAPRAARLDTPLGLDATSRHTGRFVVEHGRVFGAFHGCRLASAFQAVIDLRERRTFGHEGLLRCHGPHDDSLSPWTLFSRSADDAALVALDRHCRSLHLLNYQAGIAAGGRLFLNVHDRLLRAVREGHGHAFGQVCQRLGIATAQIALEIPPAGLAEPALLALALVSYRLNGFQVVLQLSHPQQAATVLARMHPNWLRIDADRLDDVDQVDQLLTLARRHAVEVVFGRVATQQQLDLLRGAGARWVQGWQLAAPASEPQWL